MYAINQKVTLNVKNAPLQEVIAEIQKRAKVHFVYEKGVLNKNQKISLQYPKATSLETILQALCEQAHVTYQLKDDIVSLYPESSASKKSQFNLYIKLIDKSTGEPLIMASCILKSIGAYAVTDMNGEAVIKNIPKGQFEIEISYVGFETIRRVLNVNQDLDLTLRMNPTSLALQEVVVVAKQNVSGESTSSIIGRQAIDHLQAMSLDDIMQLVPGNEMKNTDLTSKSNLQIRSLTNNTTNAFGASVVMDGVPMSNNGTLTQGGFSNSAFTGTDLRQISADNIESVEVIRGIPSAEYGDLTSGLLVVHSKVGYTPWQAKAKINPGTMNYSLGKGFKLNSNMGVLNFNLDYAKAWGDPRQKTKSFNRYTGSLGYSKDILPGWNTTTKLRYVMGKDWNGNDPDAINDGTFSESINSTIGISHNGKISVNKLFARTVSYTLGVNLTENSSKQTSIVSNSSGLLPIITATETGYHRVPFEQLSYSASGGTESKPGSIFAKVSNTFFIKAGKTNQNMKMGAEYHYDWNNARGYYNENERYPLKPNSNGRPRPFYDIPGLHQVAAYIEDNFRWDIDKEKVFKLQFGVRFTGLQPGAPEATYSLSPRINMSYSFNKYINVRGGFGLSAKTPGLDYLYPDKKYTDRIAANYMPQNDPNAQLLLYHTQVYNTQRTVGLKNAVNKKFELGVDFNLPGKRKLSIVGYYDKTPNGFGSATEYYTYNANYYTPEQGLIIQPGRPTEVDWNNPARVDVVFSTTGKVGNTNVSINKGVEVDFDLGEIPAIHTSLYLTGAYMETKTYSTDMNSMNPVDLPNEYLIADTTPFKIVYPSGLQQSIYRKVLNNLRIVTNIPALRMVASFSTQVIWHNYSYSTNPAMDPIGWIDTDLSYHEITQEMLDDEDYKIKGVLLKSQRKNPSDNIPVKSPITWSISGRLTKEFGEIGGLSFYANNILFYEPYLSSSVSSTLQQRNTGSFSFGVELFIKL